MKEYVWEHECPANIVQYIKDTIIYMYNSSDGKIATKFSN